MNKEQVFEVLKLLNDAYPNFEVTQSKIDTWARLLSNQNPAVVMQNAERYVMNNKYPPSISELRDSKSEANSNDFLNKLAKWEREAIGNNHRN